MFFFFDETNEKKSNRFFENTKWREKGNKGDWSETIHFIQTSFITKSLSYTVKQ